MSEFKKPFITIVGVSLLLGAIAFAKPNRGGGQNPGSAASKPTPTPLDVNVVNAPSVVLPSGTTVGIGTFANTVKIDTPNPLPVSDVDNPARHPFAFSLPPDAQDWSPNNATKIVQIHVPANQCLVVEQVSVQAKLLRTTNQFLRVRVDTKAGGQFSSYHIVGADVGQLDLSDNYVASSLMKMYADPGSDVGIAVIRGNSSGGTDFAEVNLSGYLVSVP